MYIVFKVVLLLFFTLSSSFYSQNGILNNYGFAKADAWQVNLTDELREVSGLALSNGRLFCHNDEFAVIYELEISSGKILKKFFLGSPVVKGDFEDLVILDNKFYLVSSNGSIFIFEEGQNNQSVTYKKIKTRLKTKNDVEGIQYSQDKTILYLACKKSAGKKYKGYRGIYEFNIKMQKVEKEPFFLLDIKKIKKLTRRKNFNPSAIKLTYKNTYLILDGKGRSLIEVNSKGELLNAVPLRKELHNQPEGIEILTNKTIIISDEAGSGKARLTFYRMRN